MLSWVELVPISLGEVKELVGGLVGGGGLGLDAIPEGLHFIGPDITIS